jgi:hypothetical protein
MPKYGRGLNREIVSGVNQGIIVEPFSVTDIKEFATKRSWEVPENYINVCLANGTSDKHSQTYKKYFNSIGEGKYKLSDEFRDHKWR